MNSVKELLIGYCDPVTLKHAVNAIGENGLTARIRNIGYLWRISRSLSRSQCYGFGMRHCGSVFSTFLTSVETTWLTETLRIMDRKESNVGGAKKQNLTVAQCHERFQNEPVASVAQKVEELRLYTQLETEYANADLREFRNKRMFHLDLMETVSHNVSIKNVEKITDLIMDWYRFVGTAVFGGEPKWTTSATKVGKQISKDFRGMMLAKRRADKAKEDKRIDRYYKKRGQTRPDEDRW